jgi:hypothetical protein
MRLVVEVRIIRGNLFILPGSASSFEVASVPEASVSKYAALRREKKFRVITSLRGMFQAGDVLVCTAAFFEVPSISLVAGCLCLRTYWILPSCVFCCPVAFGRLVWPASVLALSTALNSCNLTL